RILDDSREDVKAAEVDAAVRLARSYRDATQMSDAVVWTERAAVLDHVESLMQAAEWYDKGEFVKRDPEKGVKDRFGGHHEAGHLSYQQGKYVDAAAEFEKANALPLANAHTLEFLGRCYGKLSRWDKAAAAYARSIEKDVTSERATVVVFNMLETLICADHP